MRTHPHLVAGPAAARFASAREVAPGPACAMNDQFRAPCASTSKHSRASSCSNQRAGQRRRRKRARQGRGDGAAACIAGLTCPAGSRARDTGRGGLNDSTRAPVTHLWAPHSFQHFRPGPGPHHCEICLAHCRQNPQPGGLRGRGASAIAEGRRSLPRRRPPPLPRGDTCLWQCNKDAQLLGAIFGKTGEILYFSR